MQHRRVVTTIEVYPQPKEIFELICKACCRDRALMALCFCSAGRISEVVGGPCFKWDKTLKRAVPTGKHHPGVQIDNLKWEDKLLIVSGMKVVKRSHKIIAKYGIQVTRRDDFALPLEIGLFDKKYWDQLVPFTWLIKEYYLLEAPKKGKLFPFEDTQAYNIIRDNTGMFPNWFRAQGESFYGHYLLDDTVKLAKFVKVRDHKHVSHYIGYDWAEHLKNAQLNMDFAWIKPAVDAIKNCIGE
jgi:hypothetical protein